MLPLHLAEINEIKKNKKIVSVKVYFILIF